MQENKLLWTRDAAKKIGVHAKTLRLWIRKGIGPAHTEINGRKYYSENAIDSFLADRARAEGSAR